MTISLPTISYRHRRRIVPPRSERIAVARGTEIPEDCIARAQAVIVTESSWHIIAPHPYHVSFSRTLPIPDIVLCTILDISGLDEQFDQDVALVMLDCTTKDSGVVNYFGLVRGLRRLGAKAYHNAEEYNKFFGSKEWFDSIEPIPYGDQND